MSKTWIFTLLLVLGPALLYGQTNTSAVSPKPKTLDELVSDPSALRVEAPLSSPKKPDKLAELFGDPVVAKGQGVQITRSQLEEEVLRRKEMLLANSVSVPPDVEKQTLDALIAAKLIANRATAADRTAAKEKYEKYLGTLKTQKKWSDEQFNDALSRQLKVEGKTRAEWESQQIEQHLIAIVIQREIQSSATEPDAKKFYDEKKSLFEEPETVRVCHIMLTTRENSPDPALRRESSEEQKKAKRKLIEDLLKRARGGEDFTKLAKEYSEDVAIKDNEGEVKFSRDARLVEEFKAAAFALKVNDISDVVTSPAGYHVIKLLERIAARKEPYSGLETKTVISKGDGQRATIKEVLAEESVKKQFPDYVKKLKKDAGIEVLDPKLKIDESSTAARG